ncbi:MAG: Vitamin B12 import ATP-binding protein BtuD [Rhodocyclaceae bacterium]|nr:MAG: ATP-binding cassette domain-containing protein [Rhodocyclaceae bacterium]MBE7423454.1 ATP-binding cassette domain-containing protein [Zoogloeaceae bacterium]MBV6408934.1 Vitamin B12 import ATP-binding protein BtuD [Rhodocyclaceae bacterium]MCK6383263.1 ATP-binding cassette domain-containing protein [Rhodocyclaceae bacterium]CAG0946342.1 Linearmycin resistance ATP-binding protein LnrL [Gammaproteobacteria bacterium]
MEPLSIRGLHKSFGGPAVLAGLTFALRPGECYGLLGPNGAGKTTTLRCALGLTRPDGGEIRLAGLPVPERAREARARVGIVPQMDNLDPDFTVAENLLVYGRYFGLADRAVRARIPQLLDFAGLAGRAEAKISTLSGGMKRRLTLARALVNDPDLLFLDEPTTGLDPQARHLIWERLKQLLAQGKTVLLTTHFMDEAERLCHRLAILDRGRLIAEGSPREVIAAHIEPEVIEVYGEPGEMSAAAWARDEAAQFATRVELAGETAFCYVTESRPLLRHLADRRGLRYLHRPANLEDVFLKLTGRDLRD